MLLCYVVLCYVLLCYVVVLCYCAMLLCAMLCCAMLLCYVMLCYAVLLPPLYRCPRRRRHYLYGYHSAVFNAGLPRTSPRPPEDTAYNAPPLPRHFEQRTEQSHNDIDKPISNRMSLCLAGHDNTQTRKLRNE